MSPRNSDAQPSQPPPQPDVYVGLLFISVAALIAGIIFLVMELDRYGWQMAP